MVETLQNLGLGFSIALSPSILLYAFVGCLVGTLVGVLPGVGPLAGISLLLPATFGLDATRAIVMLAGIYYGAMYGGSTTSILMRIPGEAASVMTCIDGYAMARKGHAGAALAIAAVGSYVAGTVSVVALMLLAPPLAAFALRFGPPEYFALLVLGLLVLAYMSSGSMLKTLAMAALGLLLGMVGIDQMTGYFRFVYGVVELGDGIGVVPVAVGLFGLAEILATAGLAAPPRVIEPKLRELLPTRREWRDSILPIGRGTVLGFPGYVIRLNPGSNPPATALAEVFEPPLPGYGPRGMDIDRNGVVWTPLSSGHLASFDRRKCKGPLNGPTATGQHCPEGWTLHPYPGPQLMNVTDPGSAEASYYAWVDQFDTFGLGRNVPIGTGNANEALLALVNGKFVVLRVPYPMGFYAKWMDGRIDDPNAGWKGKGLWSTYATRTPFHVEGGKGTTSKVVKFQLRPDPLAR